MNAPRSGNLPLDAARGAAHAVLTEVTCCWGDKPTERISAVVLHAARDMWVLEAADARQALPPLGTALSLLGGPQDLPARLAELGRGRRFLVSIGERPVRVDPRVPVSLPGVLRSASLPEAVAVEIVDLTTGGCRVRGVQLIAGSLLALDFTPPGRDEPVTVRGLAVHGSGSTVPPWMGVRFRLVAMRGGR